MIQSGVDANSKKFWNLKPPLKNQKKIGNPIYSLENTIKKAANKKFQDLKQLIKSELKEELKQELIEEVQEVNLVTVSPEQWNDITAEIKKGIMEEVHAPSPPEVTMPYVQRVVTDLRKEVLGEVRAVRPPEVTQSDSQKVKEEVLTTIQSHSKQNRGLEQNQKSISPEGRALSSLKEWAFAKRLNIVVFGRADNNSANQDLRDVISFFEKEMGLSTFT